MSVKKEWYVLLQKKEDGCPFGFTNVILSQGFVANIEQQNHGSLPWYRMPRRRGAEPPALPVSGLCLIALGGPLDFDIRSIGGTEKLFAVSRRFVESVEGLSTNFEPFRRAPLVDKHNSPLSEQDHFITRSKRVAPDRVLDRARSKLVTTASGLSIEFAEVKDDCEFDLFTLSGIVTTQDTLFCSEAAARRMEQAHLRGIRLVDLSEMNWPAPPSSSQSDDLAALLDPKRDPYLMI